MNAKTIKKIRKYARFRGKNDVRLNEKILREVYENASEEERKIYNEEMDAYLEAVTSKKISPGDSLIEASISGLTGVGTTEANHDGRDGSPHTTK